MSLSHEPARRFRTRTVPRYPMASAAALLAVGACRPTTAPAGEPVAPYQGTSAPAVVVSPEPSGAPSAAASGAVLAVPPAGSGASEVGLEDARRAPHFAEDDAPLQIYAGSCRGDCAPPYESAANHKDDEQLRARAAWCVRAASARGPVSTATVIVRGVVGADQVPRQVELAPTDAPLQPDVHACLAELVARSRMTPPDHGPERHFRIGLEVGPPK